MVSTVDTIGTTPLVSHPLPQAVGEKRMVFHGLNWQQFLTIRDAFESPNVASIGLRVVAYVER